MQLKYFMGLLFLLMFLVTLQTCSPKKEAVETHDERPLQSLRLCSQKEIQTHSPSCGGISRLEDAYYKASERFINLPAFSEKIR